MTDPFAMLRSFPSRFEVAAFGDAGMALDLETGSYHRLNATALFICDCLKRGMDRVSTADLLGAQFHISPDESARAVDATLEHLAAPPSPRKPSAIQIDRDGDGFILHAHGRPVWRLNAEGTTLRFIAHRPPDPGALPEWVRWALPHAYALRGLPILHASAIEAGGMATVITGASGAGKTTLARGLAGAGAVQISEDLVALDPSFEELRIWNKTESHMHGGAQKLALVLMKDLGAEWRLETPIDDAPRRERFLRMEEESRRRGRSDLAMKMHAHLLVLLGGQLGCRLSRILFLDGCRRRGGEIYEEPLAPIDALAALLEGSFAEVPSRVVWKNVWDWSLRLAREVPCFRATVPNGLDALRSAARDYVKRLQTP